MGVVKMLAGIFGETRTPWSVFLLRARPKWFETDRLGSAVLSAVAGYVDAAGVLALLGHLPAHLTGELANAAAEVSTPHSMQLVRVGLIFLFVCAVVVTSVTARLARRRGRAPLPSLLLLLAGALALFCLLGSVFPPPTTVHGDNLRLLLGGGGAVLAMGVQNALMREALGTSCPTTVMTGNLTQFIIEIVELASRKIGLAGDVETPSKRAQLRSRLTRVAIPLSSFVLGALLGAFLTERLGLLSISLPTFGVTILSVAAHRGFAQ
jgi:uncharacterized membrane protein YoaK (UPF0700 family)